MARRTVRRILPVTVVVLALGGCGRDRIDRAALTTTTGFEPTHSAAIAEERARLGVPDDDGGALCHALETWEARFPPSVPARPGELASVIGASADWFVADVLPSVPDELRSHADALVETIREAAEALRSVEDDPRSLDALVAAGAVEPYVRYKGLYDPVYTDEPGRPIVYRDPLVAWLADPCGPKPLDSSWVPIDDGTDDEDGPLGS